ncbi:hypothetical protein FF098_010765 [Parvularcula flava]|uniref:Uncharacterized protein n=1 Tax=Aquisalinus luteolus TaxID=1566827 RepID=A0A8J3ERQ2_9PROT|nr:hypothetical protein [Aquisalinus luteolus]NHK28387.1 hypothetical protein [Aquisalinus luteolus]GGH98322.1 hypothetical protein GCM10011355_21640 [Aquisalinus luteolus]
MSPVQRLLSAAGISAASVIAFALPGITASAQEANSFTECREIADVEARLACYDGLADAIREIPEKEREEKLDQQPTVVQKKPTQEELDRLSQEDNLARQMEEDERWFGLENIFRREQKKKEVIEELVQPILAYRVLPLGNVRVVLENGQVWEQLESDDRRLQRIDDQFVQEANIRRGAMGSYFMKVEPLGDNIRVKRVQ